MRGFWMLAGGVLTLAACTQRNREYDPLSAPPPPPAAVLAPALDSLPLDRKLARMQQLLDEALANGITGPGSTRIVAVEMLSDRLLEVPPPFAWLRTGYATEARLREIQSLADRVVAELRRDDTDEAIAATDTRELRNDIVNLRRELALGGTAAPPSLDSLLASIPRSEGIPPSELTD